MDPENLSFEALTELHRLAAENGDDYLLAAVKDAQRHRKEAARWCSAAINAQQELKESQCHAAWLRTRWDETRDSNKILNDQIVMALEIMRETSLPVRERLERVELLFTYDDEELADDV